jgi:hypothetical protein
MRGLKQVVFALVLGTIPWTAFAQSGASIAGVVKDPSGGVLPGVTVEASSPVLLEKVRTGVTDGNGQYRITELLPGTYTVTFTLTGFSALKREGLELTGSAIVTQNVELKVGAVSETITVTGETPIVDVQNTTRQTVVSHAVLDALPTGRNMFNVGVLIPGVVMATGGLANQDVGGALGPNTLALAIHGGHTEDQRLTMNGVSLSTMIAGGWGGGTIPNAAGVSEIAFDTSAVSAELATGGVRINFIAKDGGNRFAGTVFGSFANDSMQGSNYTDRLKQRGLTTPGNIEKNWDFNPGFGGPIKRDRMWFYLSGRKQVANTFVPGMFYNKNANNPSLWTYVADTSRPAVNNREWEDYNARVTVQAAAKHKIGFLYNIQSNCFCPFAISATRAPEAGNDQRFPLQRPIAVDWTSPITSKLLLEASAIHRIERWGGMHLQTNGNDVDPRMVSVTDNGPGASITGLTYRNAATFSNAFNTTFHWRFAASYITGAHAFKAGINDGWGSSDFGTYATLPYSYTFNTPVGAAPTPSAITQVATPNNQLVDVDHDFGIFVQDKWTANRLTVSLGLRYDHFINSFPEQVLGPSPLAPNRNIVFPRQDNLDWQDITPKSGLAYDLFGDGKTAIKVSLNKYLRGYGTAFAGIASSPNPVAAAVNTATRPWTDTNQDYVANCDLINLNANGECGPADPLFGSANPLTAVNNKFDPELMRGFGKRDFNWEFSAGVQHELRPRVSLDVGFFRKWYGNFQATDNLLVSPADFSRFSLTAPADSRLPSGGGYVVSDFVNVIPGPANGFGFGAQNFTTLASNYGRQIEHWNGIDVNINARPTGGFIAQGGISTGRTSTDNCEVAAKLPEGQSVFNFFTQPIYSTTPLTYCKQDGIFITQVKALVAYTIPKAEVQVSGTFQSLPGVPVLATAAVGGAAATALGRPVGGLPSVFPFFQIVEPGQEFGERLNQLDVRFAKLFRAGRSRTSVNFDIYNALNADTITGQVNTYTPIPGAQALWQVPNLILQARFLKISVQFDF